MGHWKCLFAKVLNENFKEVDNLESPKRVKFVEKKFKLLKHFFIGGPILDLGHKKIASSVSHSLCSNKHTDTPKKFENLVIRLDVKISFLIINPF